MKDYWDSEDNASTSMYRASEGVALTVPCDFILVSKIEIQQGPNRKTAFPAQIYEVPKRMQEQLERRVEAALEDMAT